MTGQAREVMPLRHSRQRRHGWRGERARAANVNVEPLIGCRKLNVQRLADDIERFGNGPSSLHCAVEILCQDWTAIDRHDVVSARRGIADLQHAVSAPPRVKDDATAAIAMRVHERRDGYVNACLA